MNELFDKSILSIISLFVITLTIYILFSENNDIYDDYEDDIEGFTIDEKDENDPFEEYGTFYNITEGFSFIDDNTIEGLKMPDIGKQMRNAFEKPFKKFGKDMKKPFEKMGKDMKNAFEKPFKPVKDFFDTVNRFFKSIPKRVKHLNSGFKEFGIGFKKQFDNLGKGLKLGFSDIFCLIGTLGTCGIKFLKNLGNCIFYYIFEMIGHIIYTIFFVFPMYVIKSITGMETMTLVNQLWKMMYYLDDMLYSMTKMHFMHFPDSIIKQCYTCDFMGKVKKINKDWNHTIPKLLKEPVKHFNRSGCHFKKVIAKKL